MNDTIKMILVALVTSIAIVIIYHLTMNQERGYYSFMYNGKLQGKYSTLYECIKDEYSSNGGFGSDISEDNNTCRWVD